MKAELTEEQIDEMLKTMSANLDRISGTAEVIKDGDDAYCEVTLKIAIDGIVGHNENRKRN